MRLRLSLALWVCFTACVTRGDSELPPAAARKVDFVADIQPILTKHCRQCHGPEKQQAGLRLDRKSDALAGGDSGKAFETGKSAESLLIELVSGADLDRVMPPKGDRLTAEQVGLLRAWIDQGAVWPDSADLAETKSADHWSFKPIVRPELPAVKNAAWVRTPLDRFVLAKLEAQGLSPSPEADRATLIRRLSLDLLGLPPTLEDVTAFESDTSPDAYGRLVDRLLASPRFGERWGRHWLDLARYADSDGYEKDNVRPFAYRYRDWVINAVNDDLPYDRFTLEQLAGDLLPNATLEQKLATGFHRNTLTNTEGGADQEEFRVAATVDRVNTTGAIWLGLTIGCAQCHSHKYDAITQREYYELFAFFNSIDEKNIPAPHADESAAYERAKAAFDAAHAPLVSAQVEDEKSQLSSRLAAWEPTFKDKVVEWTPLTFTSLKSTAGAELKVLDDQSILVSGTNPETDTYVLEAVTPTAGITAIRIETLADKSLGGKGPGRTPHGNYVLSEVRLKAGPMADDTQAKDVAFGQATADFEQLNGGKPFFTAKAAVDGKPDTGWAVADRFGVRHVLILETKETLAFEGGTKLTLTLDQQHGQQHTLGRFRVSVTTAARPVTISTAPDGLAEIVKTPPESRTASQMQSLVAFFKTVDPESLRLKKAVDDHLAKAPKPPATLAQTVLERPEPRPTHIHIRGDFLRKGDPTLPDTLDVLPTAKLPEKPNRVDLAHWLTDPANPLTPRVTANQWWQWLLGKPLVATVDDFGVKGEPPSHPELLDWLAAELVQPSWRSTPEGPGVPWSRKRMIRLIVNSATYRQASTLRPELDEIDPKNLLLGRQNRFRLEAEVVRDVNLAVSGLLDHRVGGPSVRPPLPAGVAELGYAGSVKWPESKGADRYRRGMYIFFQRTVPYPMLIAFDSPDSNNACVRRERSNTPLQALTLLNDPVFYECARAFGARIVETSPGEMEDPLATAFRMCVAREPSSTERARLHDLHERLRQLVSRDPAQAAKAVGRPDASDPRTLDLAAATGLARVLLNLDEFLTRE